MKKFRQLEAMIERVKVFDDKDAKREAYERFQSSAHPLETPIMLATKAFGMGIDIGDIKRIVHFAPTGGVCDYVQEIGRAARRPDIKGEAIYNFDRRDFKFINRLHGLSSIKKYQIIEIVKKIYELHCRAVNSNGGALNKVKTALLMFQKDFEAKLSFPPLVVRPIPLFAIGFFAIDSGTQRRLSEAFPHCLVEVNRAKKICRVKLGDIWSKGYRDCPNGVGLFQENRLRQHSSQRSAHFRGHLRADCRATGAQQIQSSVVLRSIFGVAHRLREFETHHRRRTAPEILRLDTVPIQSRQQKIFRLDRAALYGFAQQT